jgi:hypothetical protein
MIGLPPAARGFAPGQSSEGARSDSIGGLESLATNGIPEGILKGAAATFSFVWLLHSIALYPPPLPSAPPA